MFNQNFDKKMTFKIWIYLRKSKKKIYQEIIIYLHHPTKFYP